MVIGGSSSAPRYTSYAGVPPRAASGSGMGRPSARYAESADSAADRTSRAIEGETFGGAWTQTGAVNEHARAVAVAGSGRARGAVRSGPAACGAAAGSVAAGS